MVEATSMIPCWAQWKEAITKTCLALTDAKNKLQDGTILSVTPNDIWIPKEDADRMYEEAKEEVRRCEEAKDQIQLGMKAITE